MSVDKYFHKKKAIAISLASTGASLSITIFTPVAEVLLDTYGFSGGMMVFAAITLNTVVCGTVVFPLKGKGIVIFVSYFVCGNCYYFLISPVPVYSYYIYIIK